MACSSFFQVFQSICAFNACTDTFRDAFGCPWRVRNSILCTLCRTIRGGNTERCAPTGQPAYGAWITECGRHGTSIPRRSEYVERYVSYVSLHGHMSRALALCGPCFPSKLGPDVRARPALTQPLRLVPVSACRASRDGVDPPRRRRRRRRSLERAR